MIDVAFISGRLGNAFFREGSDYFVLSAFQSPMPVSSLDVREVLRRGSEYSVVRNTNLPAIEEGLARGIEQHNAMFLLLALLDISVSLSVRVMAAQSAENLLASDSVLSFVRNRLLSSPLPVEHRTNRRSVMQVVGEFPLAADILHEVFEAQPVIDQLRYEWVRAFDESGVDAQAASECEAGLTEAGFFSEIVRAVRSKDLPQMNAAVVRFAVSTAFPNSRTVFTSLRSRLESTFWGAKKRAGIQGRLKLTNIRDGSAKKRDQTGDLISDLLSREEDSTDAARQMGALEAKLRVDKQISAIREMIFAGKNPIAEKYLAELLQFQLGQGDREYAVMSLCSLTAMSLSANQLEMADRLSDYAVKLGEYDVVAHTTRAEVYKVRGQFQSSLQAYEETINRFPDSRYAVNGYADVLKELGQFQKAIGRYIQAQNEFPDDPVAFNGQVSTLKAEGRFRDALDLAVLNAKRFPYEAITRGVLAGCLATLGKYHEAVRQYRAAVDYDPSNLQMATAYAYALRSSGRYREAIEFLDRYAVRRPQDAIVLNAKANILRNIGEFGRALEIFSELESRYPTYTPAKFGAAAVKLLLGQIDAAARDLPKENMESELDWIGFRTYALSFVAIDSATEAIDKLKWAATNCPWLRERTKIETALGFAQLKAESPDSLNTLQHNLEHLEDRAKQTRLIFLAAANAQVGRHSVANTILRSIFNSKDPQLRALNSAVIASYNPNTPVSFVDPQSIYQKEMNLVLAA